MRVVLGLALVAPAAALVNNGGVTPNHQPSGGTRGLVLPRHVAATAEVAAPVTVDACGVALDGQELERRLRATSFLYPEKVEVIKDLEPFVETQIEDRLLTAETAWQPMDFVPDFSKESWEEDLKDFRRQSEGITDEMLVVLIGDMVTEEALPTYQTLLNTFEGADDPTGVSQNPWSKWSRKWTSEENRHGDLLNRYLYLTGRCDMRAIEVTIQRLITSGFNAGANKDPYRGFIYTSFQERATKISHGNVGKIAKKRRAAATCARSRSRSSASSRRGSTRARTRTRTAASSTRRSRSARRRSRTATSGRSRRSRATRTSRASARPSPATRRATRRPTRPS